MSVKGYSSAKAAETLLQVIAVIITIVIIIVNITKVSIVIGSPHAYLSRDRRAITRMSNYRYPTGTFCNWIPVIGYPRDSQVNYARFNGFFRNVSQSFQNL